MLGTASLTVGLGGGCHERGRLSREPPVSCCLPMASAVPASREGTGLARGKGAPKQLEKPLLLSGKMRFWQSHSRWGGEGGVGVDC